MPTDIKNAPAFQYGPLDKQDVIAFKALADGEATEYQQRRVLNIIVKNFSRTHDVSFVPGASDQSAFIAGRAFVGSRILYYINYPTNKLDDMPTNEDSPR